MFMDENVSSPQTQGQSLTAEDSLVVTTLCCLAVLSTLWLP